MRIYTVPFENIAVAAAQDLFELTCGDDVGIGIVAVHVGNVGGTADAGDAQEEFIRAQIIRGYTVSGSGGAAGVANQNDPKDAATSFTVEINNTTIANTGTAVLGPAFEIGSRSGCDFLLPPEYAFRTTQTAGLLVVRLLAAPADSINLSGHLTVAEF